MNQPDIPAPTPSPATCHIKPDPMALLPMEPGTGNVIAALLKTPGAILHELTGGGRPRLVVGSLIGITLMGLAVFGGITASISASQWWHPVVKISAGTLFAAVICLPSLYIFAALSGIILPLRAVAGLLFSVTGLSALILTGFTPLIWVLGTSTASVIVPGALLLLVWLIAVFFGTGLLIRCGRALGMTHRLHLMLWSGMFLLVTLQVSCALRPILGAGKSFMPQEKKFFLEHWAEQIRFAGD